MPHVSYCINQVLMKIVTNQCLEDGDSDDLHRPVCVFLSGGRAITVLQMSAMVKKIPLDQHIGNLLERRTSCFMSMLFYVADGCSHDGNQLICRKFTILRTGVKKHGVKSHMWIAIKLSG